MPPKIGMSEFKMPELKLPNTSVDLNLNNTYGVGGQKSNGINFGTSGTSTSTQAVPNNTPVDMNNPAVQAQAVSTASAGQHGPLYNSRVQTGVQNMVDAHNRGQRFNSQFQTISNPTDNALNYSNGHFWDVNNSAMGPKSLAHSGYQLNIGTNQYNFGDDRIGRKLLGARRSDGTIDTTNLGRRSMRRLRNVMSSQFQQPVQDVQQGNQQVQQQNNPTTPVNLSQQFPNLFPQGFSFNQYGTQLPFQFNQNSALNTQQQQAPVQPAAENPVDSTETVETPEQRKQRLDNYYKGIYEGMGFNSFDQVKTIQQILGLNPDGYIGQNTLAAMNKYKFLNNGKLAGSFTNQGGYSIGNGKILYNNGRVYDSNGNRMGNYTRTDDGQFAVNWGSPSSTEQRSSNYYKQFGIRFEHGGILKAQQGAQIVQEENPANSALTQIFNNPQALEGFRQMLSKYTGKEITKDELLTMANDPEVGPQLEQLAQQMMKQSAKQGAKLEYISRLRGKCPEGQELVYFAKGGKVCSACMGKKMEDGGEAGYMKSFRDRQKKKQMEKCGGKMKKGK